MTAGCTNVRNGFLGDDTQYYREVFARTRYCFSIEIYEAEKIVALPGKSLSSLNSEKILFVILIVITWFV